MTFALNDDQKAIRDLAREIFAATCEKEALDKIEAAGGFFSAAAWQALSQSGLAGMAVAEKDGGGGLGLIEQCLVLRQAGQHVAPVPVLESAIVATPCLATFGDSALKSQWLPGACKGETILTVGLVDPDSRDLSAPSLQATKNDDGTTVAGTKTFVPWWAEAAAVLVTATDADGPAVYLVDKAKVTTENAEIAGQVATDSQPLSQIRFKNTPAVRIGGADAVTFLVSRSVLGRCALAWGVAKMALALTAKYCQQREQFGSPIGTFQAVSQRAGDMYIDSQAMELSVLAAAFLMDEEGTSKRAAEALWTARYFATEAGHRVVAAAQHLHGGTGFDREYPVYRCFLRARRLELGLGTAREALTELGDLIAA